jgi:hypothetical protein
MTVAEVLLRIGCTIVAWFLLYTHCLWLSIVQQVGCESDGDALWRLLLGLIPITVTFGFLIRAANKVSSVQQSLRWGAAPMLLLLPLALFAVWPTFTASTLGNSPICDIPDVAWHRWWAPAQLLVLLYIAIISYRNWRYQPA